MRQHRQVTAINEESGERKMFSGIYEAAAVLNVSATAVRNSLLCGGTVKGWQIYDSPENLRMRIKELERQLKKLED